MGKSLYIAEKPSVAQEFAKALHINTKRKDGYLESEETIVTWCVGHLVTMSYPEEYDPALKRWSLETLPFIPQEFKYEVIPAVAKQFRIVSGLLNREDVDTIYVCTDSGREGEYIYRLVEQQAGVKGKNRRRVWIDSQTEEEILRGIKEAKNLNEYDNLAASAYLRAKEDYLMGINFSRLLTLKYGNSISNYLNTKYSVVSVGRVMTCVLGMVVRREREIREFVETPFYRVLSTIGEKGSTFEGEWRAVKGSKWFESFDLYKENGFKKKEKAEELIRYLSTDQPVGNSPLTCQIVSIEKKKEKKKKEKAPKQPKEKKVKPKKEKKPKPPAEPDNTPPLPKVPVILVFVMAASILVLVLAGTHLLGYSNSFADADQAFAEGRYSDAFQAVAGEKVKEKDTDTYEKYRITAMVSAEYEAYESMMDAEVYDMALDSLIRTVQRYDKYLQDAETYGCRGEFDKIESAAETALQQDFGLTAEDARTMYALSNKETYSREIYKVLEKAGLSEVTE